MHGPNKLGFAPGWLRYIMFVGKVRSQPQSGVSGPTKKTMKRTELQTLAYSDPVSITTIKRFTAVVDSVSE